jgi:outer membrane protein TolC
LKAATTETLAQSSKEVVLQVQESQLRCKEAEKRLEVASNALLDAQETVRLLTKRFENSLATMVELLDAQTVLNQTRSNLADAEAYLVLSEGRVYHAAGIFVRELIK